MIAQADPTVVVVKTFNDSRAVGDSYRAGNVVEFVVENTDPDVARRVIDFATGLVYGGRGSMYRIDEYRYRMEPAMPESDHTGP